MAGTVFISSTSEDLREYRLAADKAIRGMRLRSEMMEDNGADGRPPLDDCLERVDASDVLVVIVAERYGWVPPGQPGGGEKSITWLECERAVEPGKELLVFFVKPGHSWPVEFTENFRVTAALNAGTFKPDLVTEVQRNTAKLKEFRTWLETDRERKYFTTPDELARVITQSLHAWLERNPKCKPAGPAAADPRWYLDWLRDLTATIDIRGLGMGAGKAHSFPIDELYIPLTTQREARQLGGESAAEPKPMLLEEAMSHRRLVISGDPGSGKTTFLRRLAFEMTKPAHKASTDAASPSLWATLSSLVRGREAKPTPAGPPFPVFLRIADLCKHIETCRRAAGAGKPGEADHPDWLVHFLASESPKFGWSLDADFFSAKLANGEAVLLLDGLDEAPDRVQRARIARLFERATDAFGRCSFVVTTRPQAYRDDAILARFHEARIEPLAEEAVDTFLDRWCKALFPESDSRAERHRSELTLALRTRPEIREMARNPVMLTALAVVHWNERRLPEQRADLYDAILVWLSRQREEKPGREKADRCLILLGELAFAMQSEPGGRLVRVPLSWAADRLARHFGHSGQDERVRLAEAFIEQETADSGIIVSRAGEVQFWHLTFQEYLAAQALAAQLESDQKRLLLDGDNLYRAEWREVVLLLAGILLGRQKSAPKVDALVGMILDATEPNLVSQARSAALLGAILRDLRVSRYEPSDERYASLMAAVTDVFDRKAAEPVPFEDRLGAAEAPGLFGDPRFKQENWVRIPGMNVKIGKYPVTVAEFQKFVDDSDGYANPKWWEAERHGKTNAPREWEDQLAHPNRPVVGVSWFEAKAYCKWAGVQLLTEAEWQRAAEGTEERTYPWGEAEPDASRANFYDGGPGHPTPVGLYPAGATPEGVLDLAGNVWEWAEDWLDEGLPLRVLRGGSWHDGAVMLSRGERIGYQPDGGSLSFGFRVAREV